MTRPLTPEQKAARARYQAEYRKKHPEYVAKCRELEKPKLERYRAATARKKRERIIREYLREGMITEGCKIEITEVYNGKVKSIRELISSDMMFNSNNKVLRFTFEKMLKELGYD